MQNRSMENMFSYYKSGTVKDGIKNDRRILCRKKQV